MTDDDPTQPLRLRPAPPERDPAPVADQLVTLVVVLVVLLVASAVVLAVLTTPPRVRP